MWCYDESENHNVTGGETVNTNEIRGVVMAKFHSVADFAKAAGWGRGKAYRVIHGSQRPDNVDIKKMCAVLGISDPADIVRLFSLS